MTKIWTFDARDTVFFDVAMAHGNLSFAALGPEIRSLHTRTIQLLSEARTKRNRKVRYDQLRNALVPHRTTADIALIFDSSKIDSAAYGMEIAKALLPLVDRRWNGSILGGDLIHGSQDLAFRLLDEGMHVIRSCEIANSSVLFAVYLSNLTSEQARTMVTGLRSYAPFVGYVDATYRSPMKNWLSVTLSNTYVKHGEIFISKHPDDVDTVEHWNSGWWPIEDHDYECLSLPSTLSFDPFLSYKIEREVLPGLESDTIHGLSTISPNPRSLDGFEVLVESTKLAYLKSEKSGSLRSAGLEHVSEAELAARIVEKLQDNYIYELEYKEAHGTSKFNIILEFAGSSRPFKVVAALEYQPSKDLLRLITLY